MRICRSKYKDKSSGKMKQARKWYIEFRDHRDKLRRIAGYTDKAQTAELGRKIDALVMCRATGRQPDPELQKWFESIPPSLIGRLSKCDLLDSKWVASTRPLIEHLDDFKNSLSAKGNTDRHVELVYSRVRKVVEGCGFVYWHDIRPSTVMTYMHGLRQSTKRKNGDVKAGISAQTFNFYLQAFKQFCRWMVMDRRATESPVAHLQGLNVRTDRRHDRRALSPKELGLLLNATSKAGVRSRMSGDERSLLYRLASETGLRAGELRSLTKCSFNLETESPTVTVNAAYTKHRREDILPLRRSTADLLANHLKHVAPAAPAFTMPERRRMAKMFRADLKAAGIPYKDDSGRVADFHALRHTFITNLANGGVHPKVAQALARHSTITLTMDRYSHTIHDEQKAALQSLPNLDTSCNEEGSQQRKTGARDKECEKNSPHNSPDPDAFQHSAMQEGAVNTQEQPSEPDPRAKDVSAEKKVDNKPK